jgi:hypothetical protein
MFAKGITSISLCPDLGKTPAIVNRKTGAMFINKKVWSKIPFNERMFIILHELGHIVKNTKNEFEADQYAFEQYAKLGLSLKDSVDAMAQVLSYSNPQHYDRTVLQLKRALEYDHKVNNQPKIEIPMFKINELNPNNTHDAFANGFYGGIHESFLGIGKKGGVISTIVENRNDRKLAKIEGKNEKKIIKAQGNADKKRGKANAAQILAEQGIDQDTLGNSIADSLGNLGAGAASVFGGGGGGIGNALSGLFGSKNADEASAAKTPEEKSNKTTWIIITVIAVVVIAGTLIYFKSKSK